MLSCYEYFCVLHSIKYNTITETIKALKLPCRTVQKIKRGVVKKKQQKLKPKNLIWEIIYNFHHSKAAPMPDVLFNKIQELLQIHYII